ncbi:hypothetical protein [Lamprocystis purpurea]|jgi:hypothetical protein|uniref:hypothetical protein n=1 Tax=Lamprocystis purpurea TaxID=61598 RepID=UPI0009FD20DD|nr:hypothetical protein [Lamprocystis purpurea]MBV5347090.1 hypothetical protein [bacterium]
MSTKEDILEQLVEEYLLHEGYFVQHNIKFRPNETHDGYVKQSDSNHSDIDVVGIHPLRIGLDKVVAVSCKSWQGGFNPKAEIEAIAQNKIVAGRERWKPFRELVSPKWSAAFIERLEEVTGTRQFTYITAVTKIHGDKSLWETNSAFRAALGGNPIKVLDMRELLAAVLPKLTTTLANTNIGRMLQLIKAAGVEIKA